VNDPVIDPALGLNLVNARTLPACPGDATVAVIIPAHNEAATVSEVVAEAFNTFRLLGTGGEVIVVASACTDDTADVAMNAGAQVVAAPLGKGAAVAAGIEICQSDVVCLVDGDMRYFGDVPLVAILVEPILKGLADATIADLYWRPIYPDLWFHAFFAPLAGRLFPELLAQVGTTPWSGQRAALRSMWPESLPAGFTVDLAILLHWHAVNARIRPVTSDDWTNPQRPKTDLLRQEFRALVDYAVSRGRISVNDTQVLDGWFCEVYHLMASYRSGVDDPQQFERSVLNGSLRLLSTYSRKSTCL
jgi:glucosyl-3-phosphoglycerate synthase